MDRLTPLASPVTDSGSQTAAAECLDMSRDGLASPELEERVVSARLAAPQHRRFPSLTDAGAWSLLQCRDASPY